ncbi:MAG: undecaprenyl-diphosphatase, partial [Chloroflexota bacterium]
MTLLQALVLGIIQGVTEYIPVSSSAHLVLVPWLLGWPEAGFVFDVLVQWGTLIAVILYFWRDLVTLIAAALRGLATGKPLATADARLAWLIVVGSLP